MVQAKAKAADKNDTDDAVYRYQVVVLPLGPDGDVEPGPDTAAVTAALNAGYRPTGDAEIESTRDHVDGEAKVVTWVVPVVKVK